MIDNLITLISNFEKQLDENNLNNQILIDIIDELMILMSNFNGDEQHINCINENLNELLLSLQDKDYMRFLDILKYEILPLLSNYF